MNLVYVFWIYVFMLMVRFRIIQSSQIITQLIMFCATSRALHLQRTSLKVTWRKRYTCINYRKSLHTVQDV